jgi:L-rhamnose mutarotase
MITRSVLAVDLRDDPAAIERYEADHRQVWPEVLSSLQRAGIVNMEIYLLGRRLVMVVETDGRDYRACFAAHHASSDPRVMEWEALMRSLQQPPPGAPPGQWWTEMRPVFSLAASRPRRTPDGGS